MVFFSNTSISDITQFCFFRHESPLILSFWIIQAALSSGCNNLLTKEHRHLLTHVTNKIWMNFKPGKSVHVYPPSTGKTPRDIIKTSNNADITATIQMLLTNCWRHSVKSAFGESMYLMTMLKT